MRDNRFLDKETSQSDSIKISTLLLNQPLNVTTLRDLLRKSDVVACADGGANRLYDAFEDDEERASSVPGFILGDLDSIKPEVEFYYRSLGTNVTKLEDQDYNDLEKSLNFLLDLARADKRPD